MRKFIDRLLDEMSHGDMEPVEFPAVTYVANNSNVLVDMSFQMDSECWRQVVTYPAIGINQLIGRHTNSPDRSPFEIPCPVVANVLSWTRGGPFVAGGLNRHRGLV